MGETLEELTYDHEEDGTLVRKQIDRVILSKGGWATLMFLYQELDRGSGRFRPPKMAIVRFKKSRGEYRKQSSFNVSSETQARQIAEVFEGWYPKIQSATQATAAASNDPRADGEADGEAEGDEAPADD
jgi:hypothetical protein